MDLQPLQIDRSKQRGPARRSRWLARSIVFVLVAGLGFLFRRPLMGQLDRLRLPEVRVLQVSLSSPLAAGALRGTAANGYIVARTRAALSADTPGRIVEMNVTEGQVVQEGFVVARLFADEYRAALQRAEADLALGEAALESSRVSHQLSEAALDEAGARSRGGAADLREGKAALELARIERERLQALEEEGIESLGRLDEARVGEQRALARVDSLVAAGQALAESERRARVEVRLALSRQAEAAALIAVKTAERDQARATLDKTEVRAPFDGVVVLKDAEIGEVVSPNAVGSQSRGSVVTMVDFDSLEVQVEVPETNLAAVVVGAPARIFLDAYPEQPYEGEVLRIWPTANRQKATVEVRVGFARPDRRLRPEMGTRVVFLEEEDASSDAPGLPAEPVILLPRSAIVTIEGQAHVFVLERDVARMRAVVLGAERSGRVAVESGLTSGERVIDAPPDSLRDGERVRVTI